MVIVGGSSSNVGKTTLACALLRRARGRRVAMKVSVTERDVATRIVVEREAALEHHGDTGRLLAAGADAVVWVTVSRSRVRAGLAAGLFRARSLKPDVLVVESTSAGIQLRRFTESWFVAGPAPWKPWAIQHRDRATHIVSSTASAARAS